MHKKLFTLAFLFYTLGAIAQKQSNLPAADWVDSVFKSLNEDEKIAQLMVVRLSSIDSKTRKVTFYDSAVAASITKYNIGGICLFQGGPITQANYINYFQSIAKTPILISIDAENGLGMRMLDSVIALPRQMMMGAIENPQLVYEYGRWVGEQCRRAGIQVDYAPVVDVNNNPNNPVINDRSFGENKYKVAQFGVMYMKGLQDVGVMACAKHFPGHGDVAVDSHLDLPVINKSISQLDSLELYPFKEMIKAGVGATMVAHLYIPAIDNTANRATSISYNNVTKLLKQDLGFQGLTFTDALEMQGVAKYYPGGEASLQSLIAGNDMLCLPGDIPGSIDKIKRAIKDGKLSWADIDAHVKKVLFAKYAYGLNIWHPINTKNLYEDLNSKTYEIKKLIAENAITLINNDDKILPLLSIQSTYDSKEKKDLKIGYLGLGITRDNNFAKLMRSNYNADVFYFTYKEDLTRVATIAHLLKTRYDLVVVGLHSYNRFPANNFGISDPALQLLKTVKSETKSVLLAFGNPYVIKNFCDTKNILACYEDDSVTHDVASRILSGQIAARGTLPVTVCENYKYGAGIRTSALQNGLASYQEIMNDKFHAVDSLANDAIRQHATPGCSVLLVKDGKIVYDKTFGYFTYDSTREVGVESIYDLASVTKICATTMAVMKLYDEGKLDLNKKLGDYLPWVRGSNKENLVISDILLHQAGLKAWIPFYRETIDTTTGIPLKGFYSKEKTGEYSIHVADSMYMKNSWRDTMYQRILQSPLSERGKYIYSDNDFIFLGKVVEEISGVPLNDYVQKEFYNKLGLVTTGFKPRDRFALNRIAPTEKEKYFRLQEIQGDVHDPGSAMFGGVAGHAGLFSSAYDLAVMMQMVLDGGKYNGYYFFSPETIKYFTAYHSEISRRGYGFDKPEKDNAKRKDPYPCLSASAETFGHTGFTGTCVWVDPKYNMIFIFLSNRVNPEGGDNNKLLKLNVRTNIQEAFYKALTSQ
ncbi:MAG: serine hydrolase [Bacteroidetes bacterium]|nr:MAG: serine hydrolase [Bacteroidota bacterium]